MKVNDRAFYLRYKIDSHDEKKFIRYTENKRNFISDLMNEKIPDKNISFEMKYNNLQVIDFSNKELLHNPYDIK